MGVVRQMAWLRGLLVIVVFLSACGGPRGAETSDSHSHMPFWEQIGEGGHLATGAVTYSDVEQILPGREPTRTAVGRIAPVDAVIVGRPVQVSGGLAYGSGDDGQGSPLVPWESPEAAFRWLNITMEVNEVLAGSVEPGPLVIEVPMPQASTLDGLGRALRSDGSPGVFFITQSTTVLQRSGGTLPPSVRSSLRGRYRIDGDAAFIEAPTGRLVGVFLPDRTVRVLVGQALTLPDLSSDLRRAARAELLSAPSSAATRPGDAPSEPDAPS